MQVCWSEKTPDIVHATWSGHVTICGVSVIEARPLYDSERGDVTCPVCAAYLAFDVEKASEAAKEFVDSRNHGMSIEAAFELRENTLAVMLPKVWTERQAGSPWGKITTDWLIAVDPPGDSDPTGVFMGFLGLAILDSLKASER